MRSFIKVLPVLLILQIFVLLVEQLLKVSF
jgi:hypothetical protein